jgi:hypothetical protein
MTPNSYLALLWFSVPLAGIRSVKVPIQATGIDFSMVSVPLRDYACKALDKKYQSYLRRITFSTLAGIRFVESGIGANVGVYLLGFQLRDLGERIRFVESA